LINWLLHITETERLGEYVISVNITYYNEPHLLAWWYDTFRTFYEQGVDVELNIADDGSLRQPAKSFFDKKVPMPNMRLFRVLKDIGFNSHGARNLLMKQTRTEWNMLSDIDRKYPESTFANIIKKELNNELKRGTYYPFCNIKKSNDVSINEYVVSKADFWRMGGYDEEFVNIHWGDRLFLEGLSRINQRCITPEWKVKYVRGARDVSYSAEVTTTQYPDDNTLICPINDWTIEEKRKALIKMVRERNKNPEARRVKKVINFEWEQVF